MVGLQQRNKNIKTGKINCITWPAKIPLNPIMTRMLKTAEPTIVPTPTSPLVMKTPKDGNA